MSNGKYFISGFTYFVCGIVVLDLVETLFKGLLIYSCLSHIDYPHRRPVLKLRRQSDYIALRGRQLTWDFPGSVSQMPRP